MEASDLFQFETIWFVKRLLFSNNNTFVLRKILYFHTLSIYKFKTSMYEY